MWESRILILTLLPSSRLASLFFSTGKQLLFRSVEFFSFFFFFYFLLTFPRSLPIFLVLICLSSSHLFHFSPFFPLSFPPSFFLSFPLFSFIFLFRAPFSTPLFFISSPIPFSHLLLFSSLFSVKYPQTTDCGTTTQGKDGAEVTGWPRGGKADKMSLTSVHGESQAQPRDRRREAGDAMLVSKAWQQVGEIRCPHGRLAGWQTGQHPRCSPRSTRGQAALQALHAGRGFSAHMRCNAFSCKNHVLRREWVVGQLIKADINNHGG